MSKQKGWEYPSENTKLARLIAIPSDECIKWTGAYFNHGYGCVRFRTKQTTAHRVAFYLEYGWFPESVDHLCRNIWCVNPKHLEAVSQAENIHRGVSPSAVNLRKTHCIRGHMLSGDNVYEKDIKRGYRRCKACVKIRREHVLA